MAVALHGLTPGPEWYAEKTMKNLDVLKLAEKIKCTFASKSEKDRQDYHKWPTIVSIVTNQGTFSKQVEYPKGSPKNMLTPEELDSKFIHLAQNSMSEDAAKQIRSVVNRLEQLSDINELTSLLAPLQVAR
jgi:2-methylcitrate dehydratase PrpD